MKHTTITTSIRTENYYHPEDDTPSPWAKQAWTALDHQGTPITTVISNDSKDAEAQLKEQLHRNPSRTGYWQSFLKGGRKFRREYLTILLTIHQGDESGKDDIVSYYTFKTDDKAAQTWARRHIRRTIRRHGLSIKQAFVIDADSTLTGFEIITLNGDNPDAFTEEEQEQIELDHQLVEFPDPTTLTDVDLLKLWADVQARPLAYHKDYRTQVFEAQLARLELAEEQNQALTETKPALVPVKKEYLFDRDAFISRFWEIANELADCSFEQVWEAMLDTQELHIGLPKKELAALRRQLKKQI